MSTSVNILVFLLSGAVVSFSARCPSPHRAIILQCREVSETLLQRDSGPVAASDVCFDGCGGSGCDHGGL